MVDFDFTGMDQLDDVESHNVDRVLRRFHIPSKLRWKIIRRTSRDNARTPCQWDGSPNGGFTTGTPGWGSTELSNHQRPPGGGSGLPSGTGTSPSPPCAGAATCCAGADFIPLEAGKQVFAYRRQLGEKRLTIVLNFSDRPVQAPYKGALVRSNYARTSFDGSMGPWEAVILG